ncbi:MAG: transglycosylase domain-containing protein [Candidatus Levyibacteriota bacterium]|nr:MAG: transglycosylase domain-containing protein [Candidatus Levybacteria bacterium]
MTSIRTLIVFILLFFIAVGDGVIFFAQKIFMLCNFILLGSGTIPKKKEKKTKQITIFPFPFFFKFKYFSLGIIFSFFFIFAPLLILIFIQDLPSPKTLVLGQIPQTTKIYDRNNTLLYQIYADQNRTVVSLADIPKQLQEATIAIEDKDFYKHLGFDISAIIRSIVANFSGKELQGGSTITQQLIKSALLTPETSLTRKLKEIILAFWAERMFSKAQILEMYFNQVPYGGTAWGAEAAAENYFGKHVKDLNLAESSFLAGIPRAPSIYSPFGQNPNLWKKRQLEVINRMKELGYITQEEASKAIEEELFFKHPQMPLYAPHFVMYVKDLLIKKYGLPFVEHGGLTVITSLDLPLQEKAQKIVADEVAKNAHLNLSNGAAMVTNPQNGDVLAMVGSRNFEDEKDGNVNVTTSPRQPGSSIKVITYAAALKKGYTAATILDDSPVTYTSPGAPSYSPVNYDGKFHGRPSLRIALANSFNITAVRTLNYIGIPAFVDMGKKMGITTWGDPKNYGLSITLGAAEVTMLDMTTVYGVLANGGIRVDVNPVLKITDSKDNILEEKNGNMGLRVLDENITFVLSNILADNNARSIEFGTNSPLNIPGYTVSVKTGTTDNKRDNWTFGYTKDRLAGVWVGNNDNSPMSQQLASGITGAAPIWHKIMVTLLEGKADNKPILPTRIITKPCLGRIEYFVRGTENTVNCNYRYSATPSALLSPNQ